MIDNSYFSLRKNFLGAELQILGQDVKTFYEILIHVSNSFPEVMHQFTLPLAGYKRNTSILSTQ